MIASAAPKNFTDTAALKQRFQQAAAKATEKQEVVDKLERMADGFMTLDQTEFDQDDKPGSVAVGDDKGMLAYVTANPFGGYLSLDVLDERGGETKEYSIETDMLGQNFSMDVNGVKHAVYQNGNGLLALMAQLGEIAPQDGEAPEESKKKAPKE